MIGLVQNTVHLNDESCDDDSDAFISLAPVSVQSEAGTSPAEQFDAGNPVDVNIWARHGFYVARRYTQRIHESHPTALIRRSDLSVSKFDNQYALHNLRLLTKISRAFSRNLNFPSSASFQKNDVLIEPDQQHGSSNESEACAELKTEFRHVLIPIRLRTPCIAPARATIAGDIAPHGVTGALFKNLAAALRIRRQCQWAGEGVAMGRCSDVGVTAPNPRGPHSLSSQPFAMSGQLASSGFIVVARLVFQRAYSLRSNKIENPTTDRTEALPGIIDLSAFCFGPHEKQSIMRGFEDGQNVFTGMQKQEHV